MMMVWIKLTCERTKLRSGMGCAAASKQAGILGSRLEMFIDKVGRYVMEVWR